MYARLSTLLLSTSVLFANAVAHAHVVLNGRDSTVYITHILNGWLDFTPAPLRPAVEKIVAAALGSNASLVGILLSPKETRWEANEVPEFFTRAKLVVSQGQIEEDLATSNHILLGGNLSACLGRTLRSLIESNQKKGRKAAFYLVVDGIYDFSFIPAPYRIDRPEDKKFVRVDNVIDRLSDHDLLSYLRDGFMRLTFWGQNDHLPFSLQVFRGNQYLGQLGSGPFSLGLYIVHADEIELR